jgi:hypothetical protein
MPSNIWIAASDNNIPLVREYISGGTHTAVDKDPNGYTPIHAAASYGHIELLRYLVLEAGGDINVTDLDGDTPLHTVEDIDTAKVMVEELDADYKIKNREGQTVGGVRFVLIYSNIIQALEKIEEEDEFPEIIQYLRSLVGGPVVLDDSTELPENASLRLTYEGAAPSEDIDPEQRRRLEEIMSSENPEEGLRQFVQQAVHSQFGGEVNGSASGSKKARQD